MCLLRELYGAGVEKLRIEHQTVVVSVSHANRVVLVESLHTSDPSDAFKNQTHLFLFFGFCFQAPSKKKIEINTIASNYHLEVNARQGRMIPGDSRFQFAHLD